MRQFSLTEYHKGFYACEGESICQRLRNIEYEKLMGHDASEECGVYDAYDFLQGACNVFAYVLQEVFCYDVFAIKEGEKLIHMFCKTEYQGKRVYVDVRGATTSYDEFIRGFEKHREEKPTKQNTKMEKWDKADIERYEFAKSIIRRFMEYYE